MSRNVSSLPAESSDTYQSRLSAMVDGELDLQEQSSLTQRWATDARVRSDWHLYHLMGDVMRSDDLAQLPAGDAQFLAALRGRLAAEPVVLAPTPERPSWRRLAWQRARRWTAPAAVAAGVMSVAGVAVMTRDQWSGPQAEPTLAAARTPAPVAAVGASAQALAQAGAPALVRDPALDRYLELHRQQARAAFAPADGVRTVVMQPSGQ